MITWCCMVTVPLFPFTNLKPPNCFKFLRNHKSYKFLLASSPLFTHLWTFWCYYNSLMGSVRSRWPKIKCTGSYKWQTRVLRLCSSTAKPQGVPDDLMPGERIPLYILQIYSEIPVRIAVFWDVMMCTLVHRLQHSGSTCCTHLLSWIWTQQVINHLPHYKPPHPQHL